VATIKYYSHIDLSNVCEGGDSKIIIKYFTVENLNDFLFTETEKEMQGLLQQFIEPLGDHQTIIQAV